jgi:hypothetical protein
MTRQSANPRRYSKGEAELDYNEPILVYLALYLDPEELPRAISLVKYLKEQHPQAVVDIVGFRREGSESIITLQINMGPGRQALRGEAVELHAGYDFLWDTVKTLYYASPIFSGPPHPSERESLDRLSGIYEIHSPSTKNVI